MPKRVWLIGDTNRSEFLSCVRWLEQHSHLTQLPVLPGDEATDRPSPELIMLAQSWPGQWPEAAVDGLHRRWPLARLVVLLGSWSEGETRSGQPLRHVRRLFWYEGTRQLSAFLAGGAAAFGSSWHLPRVATDGERLLSDLVAAELTRRAGLLVIAARSRVAYDSLSEACRVVGYATVWQRPGGVLRARGAVAGIWDGDHGHDREWSEIDQFVGQLARVRVIVTLGFPRERDWERAAGLGATLLPKPFALPDLWLDLAGPAGVAPIMAGAMATAAG